MKPVRLVQLVIVPFVPILLAVGCGSSNNNNQPATCANVAGTWTTSERVYAAACGNGTYDDKGLYVITQSGCSLTVTDDSGNTFMGSISGNQASWSGSYPSSGGTTTITSLSVTVDTSGNSCSGNGSWTWHDTTSSCSGTTTFTGTRSVPNFTLTVSKVGTGSGTVTGTGITGIDCGSDCTETVASGTSIVLTATPTSGSTFGGWTTGCDSQSDTTCTVSMTADKNVTAVFNGSVPSYTLTVSKVGTGSGTVTGTGITGIDCGSDCTETVASGTSIVLTATPISGSTFGGWTTGCDSQSDTTCTVSMTADKNVTATFNLSRQTVTLNVIATNMVEYNSLDSAIANTVFQNTYPAVGINSFWNFLGGATQAFAGVVKFNVSSLSGKTIESATLNVTSNSAPVGYHPKNWKIGTIATSWSPTSVTWNTRVNFLYYTVTWQTFSYPTRSNQNYTINVLTTVQNWANGTYPNNGIGFLSADYTSPGNVDSLDAYDFVPPTLTVTYH